MIRYNEMNEVQKNIFIEEVLPLVRVKIESNYDEVFEEWEEDFEAVNEEFNRLLENKDYEELCLFIYENNLIP